MSTVAVVGLGAMGGRIARRFLDARHDLVVWNRDPSKADGLVEAGATRVSSPAEAARCADVVVTMVADPQALRVVTEGPDGIASGARPSTTVVQMSTVGPEAIARLESVMPPETGVLDAPVLGGTADAEAGRLTVFAAGPPHLVERWTPLLTALGSVLPVGPLGAGTASKLVANSTLLGVLCLLGEALALADGMGIARPVAFEALAKTPLAAQAERRRPAIAEGRYPPHFTLSLARKDADLIVEAAAAHRVDLRLLPAARAWFADAERSGSGAADYSAVLTRILE